MNLWSNTIAMEYPPCESDFTFHAIHSGKKSWKDQKNTLSWGCSINCFWLLNSTRSTLVLLFSKYLLCNPLNRHSLGSFIFYQSVLPSFHSQKKLWNPLLLQSHVTFVYLQRNIVDNNKVSSQADMSSCGPFVFAKGIIGVYGWSSVHAWLIRC